MSMGSLSPSMSAASSLALGTCPVTLGFRGWQEEGGLGRWAAGEPPEQACAADILRSDTGPALQASPLVLGCGVGG